MSREGGRSDLLARGLKARAAERELTFDDLTYLNRMTTVGQVLPNVAHELNNGFQVIGGLVEMLASRGDLPPDVVDKVGRIGAQVARATGLVQEIVAFARRDGAGIGLVDLAKVIDRTLAMRRYHLARARIAVHVEAGRPGESFVRADGPHLQQLLLNLLVNAEQSLGGREAPAISVRVNGDEGWVELAVTDNGAGMEGPLCDLARQPFFTTRGGGAAGLGLSVAVALAEHEGGRLTLDSQPGHGTTVKLRLPRARPAEERPFEG